MRGVTAYLEQPEFQAYLTAVFNGMWTEKLNMESPEVIAEVLSEAGIDATDFMHHIGQSEVKERLKAITEEAITREVFGAPSFFVNDEMFFGQDRLDFVDAVLGDWQ